MRKLAIAITITSLVGCSMGHRDPVEVKAALNESINESNSRALTDLPPEVSADLMPELSDSGSNRAKTLKRFRVKADGVDAKAFFTSLVN